MIVPLVSWPVTTLSIIAIVLSVLLSATVLLHKSRGGGMSDLFGGGMSTSMGGVSMAEKNLDRLTIIVSVIWLACIVALGLLYKFGA